MAPDQAAQPRVGGVEVDVDRTGTAVDRIERGQDVAVELHPLPAGLVDGDAGVLDVHGDAPDRIRSAGAARGGRYGQAAGDVDSAEVADAVHINIITIRDARRIASGGDRERHRRGGRGEV